MTRIFVAGLTALALIGLAACAEQDADHQKKTRHKYGEGSQPPAEVTDTVAQPPTPAPTPDAQPTPTPTPHVEVKVPPKERTQKGDVPYATPVPGKPGFVTSPFAPYSGYVDVRGFPPGTEVKCPYSGKIFLVP